MTLSKRSLTDALTASQAFCRKLYTHLPYLYLLYAIPAVVLTIWFNPPFQTPDEPHHFCRAEQISRGEIVAFFYTDGLKEERTTPDERVLMRDIGGYLVNEGLKNFALPFTKINIRRKSLLRQSMVDSARTVTWNSAPTIENFANTAIYPPIGYLAVTIGILAGKLTNASVMNTFYFARLLNGIACIFICFYALRIAFASRLLLFTVLLLPMTTYLFSSVSQDGTLISLAFLFFAIIDKIESSQELQYSQKQLIIMVTAIIALGAARPPYFIFSFLFFFLKMNKVNRQTCFLASLLPVVLWGFLNQTNYAVVWAHPALRINSALQIQHILANPVGFAGLFFRYNIDPIKDAANEFIGVFGWKELFLANSFYIAAFLIILLSAVICINYKLKENLRLRSVFFTAAIVTGIAIMIVQYITWMPLESPFLGGVQGRYFIPVFPAIALALAGFQKDIVIKKWQTPLYLGILVFPVFSIVVSVLKLLMGYYPA